MIKKKTRVEKIIDMINTCPEDCLRKAIEKVVIDIDKKRPNGFYFDPHYDMNENHIDTVYRLFEYNLTHTEGSNNG